MEENEKQASESAAAEGKECKSAADAPAGNREAKPADDLVDFLLAAISGCKRKGK